MAERPDLEYVVPALHRALSGQTIADIALLKPVVLRLAVPGSLKDALVGQTIEHVRRRGHFVTIELEGEAPTVDVAIVPMLAGKFQLTKRKDKKTKSLALTIDFGRDDQLRYLDDVQMGKIYVYPRGEHHHVPLLESVGVDVLDSTVYTRAAFAKLAKKRRDQVRVFLMDKTAFDSFGNAYADEVLFEAQIHPKTFVRSLSEEDLDRLFSAASEVTRAAVDHIKQAKPPLDKKLRDFLKVRNRHKEPCPRCQTPIRKAGVRGYDCYFCPQCQPETRKSSIVSWRQ